MSFLASWRGTRSADADPPSLDGEFNTIIANTSMAIGIVDEHGYVVRANSAMERFLGYGPGELKGVSVNAVLLPEDRIPDGVSYLQGKFTDQSYYQVEKRYVRRDGSLVRGRLSSTLMRRSDNGSAYVMSMIEDITEQQRMRHQLDDSQARLDDANYRLKLYLDRAPLASVVWGIDRVVREWNPAAERMFGYTAAEAIGRDVYELIVTPEGNEAIDVVRRKFLAGEPYADASIVKNRRKDGTEFYCEWYFSIVSQLTDSLNGVIAFGTDITARIRDEQDRRQLEANLRQAQKMQSLGTLAGGIAHDFNNILLAISGNTKLAMQELPAEHATQRSLQEISKASARASSIVNQILVFGRREEHSGRVAVRLNTVVDEALTLLRATLPARVAIRTEIAPNLPHVSAEPGQLHQVLLNLATNAAHAIGEATGSVAIRLDAVDIDDTALHTMTLSAAGRYVRISVQDSGVGMSTPVLERIFEPFFTTKPHGQGTGLGLAVVHGIVRAHGGAIEVASTPGEGTTIYVYLPALSDGPDETVVTATPTVHGAGQHVLYVDDEEALVYLITRVLERIGYRVSGFVDAEAALAAFRLAPDSFDVVVTDLSMPGLSGTELSREILSLRPTQPIVMTSGYVRPEDRELALSIGVRELLMKPNTVDALGLALHRLLSASGNSSFDQDASAIESKMT